MNRTHWLIFLGLAALAVYWYQKEVVESDTGTPMLDKIMEADIDEEQFEKGFAIEKEEHGLDDEATAKIVTDHLIKDKDYYKIEI